MKYVFTISLFYTGLFFSFIAPVTAFFDTCNDRDIIVSPNLNKPITISSLNRNFCGQTQNPLVMSFDIEISQLDFEFCKNNFYINDNVYIGVFYDSDLNNGYYENIATPPVLITGGGVYTVNINKNFAIGETVYALYADCTSDVDNFVWNTSPLTTFNGTYDIVYEDTYTTGIWTFIDKINLFPNGGFLGSSASGALMVGRVISGVTTTGASVWPFFVFAGVGLAFVIALSLVGLIRASAAERKEDEKVKQTIAETERLLKRKR